MQTRKSVISYIITIFIFIAICATQTYRVKVLKTDIKPKLFRSTLLENMELSDEVYYLGRKCDSLELIIANGKKVLNQLKKQRDEKVNVIHNYTNDQLFKFFAGTNIRYLNAGADSTSFKR